MPPPGPTLSDAPLEDAADYSRTWRTWRPERSPLYPKRRPSSDDDSDFEPPTNQRRPVSRPRPWLSSILSLFILFLCLFPIASAMDPELLRSRYGTVDARHTLTAYDCSDPSSVEAFSSFPWGQV